MTYLIYLITGFSVLFLVLNRLFFQASRSSPAILPAAKLSPYAVAQLRSPGQGPAELALYELWAAQLVETHPSGAEHHLKNKPYQPNKPNQPNKAKHLTATGRAAYKLLESPISFETFAARFAETPSLQKEIEPLLQDALFLVEEDLQPESTKIRAWIMVGGCLLLLPGISKWILGLMRDKPILLLTIEIVLACIVLAMMYFAYALDQPQATPKGQKLLSELQHNHRWLLSGIRDRYKSTDDMSLAVALFGRESLAAIPAFAGFLTLSTLVAPPQIPNHHPYHSSAGGGSSGGDGGGDGGGGCAGCGGCGGCGG